MHGSGIIRAFITKLYYNSSAVLGDTNFLLDLLENNCPLIIAPAPAQCKVTGGSPWLGYDMGNQFRLACVISLIIIKFYEGISNLF